jgi:hypothetical protein
MGVFLFRKEAKPNICVLLGKLNTFSGKKQTTIMELSALCVFRLLKRMSWAGLGMDLGS